MEFNEVLEKRISVRKFKSTEIPDKKIGEILRLAQLAPSAGNVQAYKVKVIKNKEDKEKLRETTYTSKNLKQEWIADAPVVLVICASTEESEERFGQRGKDFYSIQDATIFASYVQLAITCLGMASVWVGNFTEENLKDSLGLPENLKIVALIPFGYFDIGPQPRQRKKLEDILLN